MQIQYTSQFSQQLTGIIHSIETRRGNQIATRYLQTIDKAINRLIDYPEIHAVYCIGESSRSKYRRINIKEYSVYYCYNRYSQVIAITDIYHSKQNIINLLHWRPVNRLGCNARLATVGGNLNDIFVHLGKFLIGIVEMIDSCT